MKSLFKQPSLEDVVFDLKFSGKQLTRYSQKAESESKMCRGKLKKALEARNVDAARIYAEDSIRKHKESIQYMVMASRLDAVQSRLRSASTMKTMTKDIGKVTNRLKSSMASMNLEKIEEVMGDFEKTFTDLDVRTSTVEGSMNTVMATSAPENEIQSLIKQVAEENGLEVEAAMAGAQVPTDSIAHPISGQRRSQADDALTERLAALRN
ncbi:chmp1 chromatin modifying protein [Echinococcus multilocularis]|uniref:Chmp1 chromatin modifying protein n=1 Tax=Echinococcus multilocularis TaxID=6211 RepID=A0A068Y2Y3_ECHMU|nr:chmp1 chromatin modifying protein [Echinococcus multilocularis]